MDPVNSLDIDGSMVHRWELARNLANLGCEVHIICYTDIIPGHVHIHSLPKKSKIGYIVQLLKLVIKYRFDIIYTRNILRGAIGILIRIVWKSKLVFEVNGISLDELRLEEEQSTTDGKRSESIQIKFLGYLGNIVSRKADAVIAVTKGIKDNLIDHGVNENRIRVIENGANTELFKPTKNDNTQKGIKNRLHINDSETVVLFVGYLAPWQGVECLLHAVPLIVEENPKTKFLIVGDGIMKEKLKSLTKELNIRRSVIFTGTVPYESVPEYMNLSDICVAPFIRRRNESIGLSPLKIYEYLACGKPVVGSDIRGVGTLLDSSNSGIPVIPDAHGELARAIIRLLNDKQLRKQMGKNGREIVVNNHSWEITAKKTIEVFESILDK